MNKNFVLATDAKVKDVFNSYPQQVKSKMQDLRALVLEVASKTEGIDKLEETLKWGEPSYKTKHGSTIRMDWKEKSPNQYALYFQCTSSLVTTFRTIYKNTFEFEGNRAIIFKCHSTLPVTEVKHCIEIALTYHKRKHLPLLGA
ncbi:DUF1801 domain-containing protein [Tamlana sp. 2201CG12-4]|uniref:DUF1801 domain-containing protein n=1 Tax=Tamlana sp. 2201CG12-4 TaxID=3112582 RepID=UPI002DB8A8CB|nr:DUF1801 domain-containing protein [Tamlana sp. 2201CG12-4]MEC3907229.1 DUF1801 domain-containing protein [Tamlana sp. 2201CG12-4]